MNQVREGVEAAKVVSDDSDIKVRPDQPGCGVRIQRSPFNIQHLAKPLGVVVVVVVQLYRCTSNFHHIFVTLISLREEEGMSDHETLESS